MSLVEIRAQAAALLKGNWLIMIVGYVLSLVSWTLFLQLFSLIFGTINLLAIFEPLITGWSGFDPRYLIFPIIGLILLLLFDLLHMSYRWFGLDLVDYRKDRLEIRNIFQGLHQEHRKRFAHTVFLRFGLVFLWSFLFVIPGFWKAYTYSQALNIIKDDSTITPMDALKQSEKLMKGKIGTYLILQLSFAIWYIIPIGLYVLFILNNLEEIYISTEVGPEAVELVYGMLFGVLFLLGLLLIFISFYVEPKKMVNKQVFYRMLTQESEESTYDSYEKKLLKKQRMDARP